MASTYSERLLSAATPNVWIGWRCPAGKRAVVRCLTIITGTAAGGAAGMNVASIGAFWHLYQAANTTEVLDLRHVLYGGELLELVVTAANMVALASGYVFTDTGGPPAEDAEFTARPFLEPEQLPRADAA